MSEDGVKEPETLVPNISTAEAAEDFRPFDDLLDRYDPSPIPKTTAADGLPSYTTMGDNSDAHVPALSCASLVCMEDTSSFVRRDSYGRIQESYDPDQVERRPNGLYYLKVLSDFDRAAGRPSSKVEPVRPRCRHYVRQLVPFDGVATSRMHLRMCSGRRSTEGAFMSVGESAVWACSMREPRDLESEKLLESFDEQRIREGATRVAESIFSNK